MATSKPDPKMEPKLELDPKYDNYDYPTIGPVPQSGHPGHLTKEQDAQVFQLRSQLEQAGYTERLDIHTMVNGAFHQVLSIGLTIPSCAFYEHGNSMSTWLRKCRSDSL